MQNVSNSLYDTFRSAYVLVPIVKAGMMNHSPEVNGQILFLCTGNYYRSRFAECLFNHRAKKIRLSWTAISRGIAIDLGVNNVGPISVHTVAGLTARGIDLPDRIGFPRQVSEPDLMDADRVIALKEQEHRSLLAARFPGWPDRVDYWHVDDVGGLAVASALDMIDREVRRLIARLAHQSAG